MGGGDLEGSGNDAFDEDAFARAMFAGELDGSEESENDLGTALDGPVAGATQAAKKNGKSVSAGAGKKCRAPEEKQRKKKRKQSGDVLVGYEQYAHLLDQYDEVNKQELPAELPGDATAGRRTKHRKHSKRRR